VATFLVAATSSSAIRYQWRLEGMELPGATNSSLTISNVQVSDGGAYDCRITDASGTIYSAVAQLYALVTPVIVLGPVSQTVAAGSPVTLSVAITGNPPPFSYQWRSNSLIFALITTNSRMSFISSPTSTNAQSTTFRIVVTNAANPGSISVNAQCTITTMTDSDHDGLPDAWELAYGLDPNNAFDRTNDFDGDGMLNWQEYVAGTDPTDPLSYLKIDLMNLGGGATVAFSAVSNRTYTVQFTDALPGGAWSKLADVLARTNNRVETIFDSGYTTNRFYRLVTPQQP
jgi:hypothetical protein